MNVTDLILMLVTTPKNHCCGYIQCVKLACRGLDMWITLKVLSPPLEKYVWEVTPYHYGLGHLLLHSEMHQFLFYSGKPEIRIWS